jgi:hypothetical protein
VGVGGREGGFPSSEEESPPEEEGDEGGGEGGGEGGIPDPPAVGFVFESVGFTVGSISPNCSLTSEKSKGWLHGRCGCLRLAKALCDLIRDCLKIS